MKLKNFKFQISNFKILFLVSFFISAFCILLFAFSVQAVSISPLKHTVVIDPGATQDISFVVTNDSDQEKTYTMVTEGFVIDAQSGRAEFGEVSPAQQWISFPAGNTFVLQPTQQREVVATARVPVGEIPNTYYIGVFAQESAGTDGDVRLGARVGTLMFLTVAGTVVEDVQIDYLTPASFISTQPPTFQLQLSNNGTIVSPYIGTVTLINMSGREVSRVVMHDGIERVYAGMKKRETIDVAQLSWRDIGPLRATAVVQYGVGQTIASQSTVVWYLPLWSYALGAALIGSIVWFSLYLKKRKQL
jgi:hypothetical protein